MKRESITVRLTFNERLLGSAPNDPQILKDHLTPPNASMLKEEMDALPKPDPKVKAAADVAEAEEEYKKTITVFPRDDKGLLLWDYQTRGFLKEQIFKLIELGDCAISRWSYKKAVDSYVLPNHRRNYYMRANGCYITKPDGIYERPARVDTQRGERVCIVASEYIDPPFALEFGFTFLVTTNAKSRLAIIDRALVVACMDMGTTGGFGQWRSGGFGKFTWEEVEAPGTVSASAEEEASATPSKGKKAA